MNDDRVIANLASVEALGGCTTDALRKSEGEETDTCHKHQDDAYQAHLLAPGTLLFGTANAYKM